MPRLDLSVVVPVRDGAGTLPVLLGSLERQTLARDRYEVIVVDNGSRDGTADIAQQSGAKVISDPVPNRARARNLGAAAARGDRIAFIDADCIATPTWLAVYSQHVDSAPLLAGPVVTTTGDSPNLVERFERGWRFAQEGWVRDGWAATANLCVEPEALRAVGGFDEAYRHIAEDADFCIRAGRAGYPLRFCADAEVLHPAETDIGPTLKRFFWHGYSSAQAERRIGGVDRP